MRRYSLHAVAIVALLVVFGVGSYALAGGTKKFDERLIGYQEVPAVSTQATGRFTAHVAKDDESFTYTLSYTGLEGTVQQSHIHLGQRGVAGGIAVWLCGNVTNTPAGVQACPAPPATITGTVTKNDIVGPSGQGLADDDSAAEFAELLRAMRAGVTYANVHSSKVPTGEIRAQLDDNNKKD